MAPQPSPINSLMRRLSWRCLVWLRRSRASRSFPGRSLNMTRKAKPTRSAWRQIMWARNERPLQGMVRLRSSGSLAVSSISMQAPPWLMLRTTQSIVDARSLISATAPRNTLPRTRWRRSCMVSVSRNEGRFYDGSAGGRGAAAVICRVNVNRPRLAFPEAGSHSRSLAGSHWRGRFAEQDRDADRTALSQAARPDRAARAGLAGVSRRRGAALRAAERRGACRPAAEADRARIRHTRVDLPDDRIRGARGEPAAGVFRPRDLAGKPLPLRRRRAGDAKRSACAGDRAIHAGHGQRA